MLYSKKFHQCIYCISEHLFAIVETDHCNAKLHPWLIVQLRHIHDKGDTEECTCKIEDFMLAVG